MHQRSEVICLDRQDARFGMSITVLVISHQLIEISVRELSAHTKTTTTAGHMAQRGIHACKHACMRDEP